MMRPADHYRAAAIRPAKKKATGSRSLEPGPYRVLLGMAQWLDDEPAVWAEEQVEVRVQVVVGE